MSSSVCSWVYPGRYPFNLESVWADRPLQVCEDVYTSTCVTCNAATTEIASANDKCREIYIFYMVTVYMYYYFKIVQFVKCKNTFKNHSF